MTGKTQTVRFRTAKSKVQLVVDVAMIYSERKRKAHAVRDGEDRTWCGRTIDDRFGRVFIPTDCKTCMKSLNTTLEKLKGGKKYAANDKTGRATSHEDVENVAPPAVSASQEA